MRIGLCWKGSATHNNDRTRSMPLAKLAPVLSLRGFEFQSLQFGEDVPGTIPCPTKTFYETAQAIESCDLVITVDTSVAHLAGCQNVPTWLLLPFVAEWRWLQDRTDSPWYPSMTLYRQAKAGDWEEVIERVVRDLQALNQKAA